MLLNDRYLPWGGETPAGGVAARKKAADLRARVTSCGLAPQLNDDAFAKFDRMREKVEMAEAEADALRELTAGDISEPKASDAASGDEEIDAQLDALKRNASKRQNDSVSLLAFLDR